MDPYRHPVDTTSENEDCERIDAIAQAEHIDSVEMKGKQASTSVTEVTIDHNVKHSTNAPLEVENGSPPMDCEDTFPEGGLRAWLVVLGAFLMLFPSFGLQVSIGTLQDYWAEHQLSEYSVSAVAWIPSVFVYLGLALGLFVGPLFDRYGPRYIALTGSTIYIVMLFLLAQCVTYWQIMLCCGFFGGIGAALLTTTSLAAVSHWFKVKRGMAQGIAMCGSSFGGLTIPLILRVTFPKYGYQWSIRILGFIFLVCLVVANVLLKARIVSRSRERKALFSPEIFKDPRVCFLIASIFGLEVVLFGALGALPTYARLGTKFPANTGFYLISILNGCSCLGRLLPGYVADRIGRFNVLFVMIVLTLICMLVIWLPFGTRSLAALYAFGSLFGFCTGSWMAIVPACIGQLCRAEEFGTYYGSSYFIASLSLLICIPISGELIQTAGGQSMAIFSCLVLFASILMFAISRWACLGWRWSWTAKV